MIVNCAGPSSPFGAINRFKKPQQEAEYLQENKKITFLSDNEFDPAITEEKNTSSIPDIREETNISFYPDRQILHAPSKLKVIINTDVKINRQMNLKIFYNGDDMTSTILANSRMEIPPSKDKVILHMDRFKLSPDFTQRLNFYFQANKTSQNIGKELRAPECRLRDQESINSLVPFEVNQTVIEKIIDLSKEANLNPALIAGLIAQESGFNSKAISWAKAIGLTQITTLAEKEVTSIYSKWPRHPSIPSSTAPFVKALVSVGTINRSNEWRLNPELAIRGGITYLDKIIDYWSEDDNRQQLESISIQKENTFLKVILASYNSGAARVKFAMKQYGSNWLKSKKLKEAKSYISKIYSYCYHFSQRKTLL